MCGIVGLISFGKNGMLSSEVSAFTQMLYADEVRGSDGTGIFFNSKKNRGNIKILKGAIPSSVFIKTQKYADATKTLFNESNFAIGHNRSATKGKINDECTHPFREKHITLIHNGTLNSQKELHEDAEVDSHAICHSIADIGALPTIKKLNGAFALVWFDGNTKTLHICKNSLRPLNIIETTTCYILCSELELGLWICKRNNMTVKSQKTIESKELYTFHIKSMEEYTTTPVEFRKEVWPVSTWSKGNDYSYQTVKYNFAFGETIRFKTGPVRQSTTDPTINYLEGDILRYQTLPPAYAKIESDWEDEWRIRIMGPLSYLQNWANGKDITGKVERAYQNGNKKSYVVSDPQLTPEPENKVLQLAHVYDENDDKCAWCKGPISTPHIMYGMEICEVCKAEQDDASCQYCG